jgi:hypothetical protein
MVIGIVEPTHSLRIDHDSIGSLLIVLGPTFCAEQNGDVAGALLSI